MSGKIVDDTRLARFWTKAKAYVDNLFSTKVKTDVPANAVFTDTTYSAGTNVQISSSKVISATDTKYNAATTSAAGLMSAADKVAVNKIGTGTLNTSNKNCIAAINELLSGLNSAKPTYNSGICSFSNSASDSLGTACVTYTNNTNVIKEAVVLIQATNSYAMLGANLFVWATKSTDNSNSGLQQKPLITEFYYTTGAYHYPKYIAFPSMTNSNLNNFFNEYNSMIRITALDTSGNTAYAKFLLVPGATLKFGILSRYGSNPGTGYVQLLVR